MEASTHTDSGVFTNRSGRNFGILLARRGGKTVGMTTLVQSEWTGTSETRTASSKPFGTGGISSKSPITAVTTVTSFALSSDLFF